MSAALFLNPNLTTEQAIHLSKMQTAGFVELCESLTRNVEQIKREHGEKAATEFFLKMYPLIVQQMVLCF